MTISRRTILRGGAGAAIALPWLEVMQGRVAQAAGPPPRFIAFGTVLGTYPERFWPRAPGSAAMPPTYKPNKHYNTSVPLVWPVTGCCECPALDTAQFVLPEITAPLDPWRSRLTFVEGLDTTERHGHGGFCSRLTGATPPPNLGYVSGGGISLDQQIANRIGNETRYKSLHFGIAGGGLLTYAAMSWYGLDKALPAEGSPAKMYARMFGSVVSDPAAMARLRSRRQSVLDHATLHITKLGREVGAADRAKLENYFESLREVERRLLRVDGGCAVPGAPAALNAKADASIPAIADLQIDLLATAVQCDLARVFTLQIGNEGTVMTHPWLGITQRYHDLSHTDLNDDTTVANFDKLTAIGRWQTEQLAKLLKRLESIPEGGGTALDNTIVFWFNGLTMGSDHTNDNTPLVLIGNVNKYFKTGRHVRYERKKGASNGTMNDLMVQIARAYGLDVQTFGAARSNRRTLDNLRA